MAHISEHITFREAVRSKEAIDHGITNIPSCEQMKFMHAIAKNIFEPLRKGLGGFPIYISSFFRNKRVNQLAGGVPTSKHTKGQAMDLDADVYGKVTNKQIFDYIKDNLEFDKLIWERGDGEDPAWVHVSYVEGKNRGLAYIAKKVNGKLKYFLYDEYIRNAHEG